MATCSCGCDLDGVVVVKPGKHPQSAVDSHPAIVALAPVDGFGAVHQWDEPVVFPNHDPVPDLVGFGVSASVVKWETDGGSAIVGTDKGNQQIRGIQFRAGSGT